MIRTARLTLRRPAPGDRDALIAALNDFDVARQLASIPHPFGQADADAWFARTAAVPMMFAVALDDRLAGVVAIGPSDDAVDGELGYWIARPFWGAGFATEAVVALVDHAAAAGVRTLHATHYLDNPASARVLVKACFVDTGREVARYSRARGVDATARLFRRQAD